MQILEKRTSEDVRVDIDCSMLLGPDETIQTVTSKTAEPTSAPPIVLAAPSINTQPVTYTDDNNNARTVAIGKVIQLNISGGLIPTGVRTHSYILRFVLQTSANPAVEATVLLILKDQPS